MTVYKKRGQRSTKIVGTFYTTSILPEFASSYLQNQLTIIHVIAETKSYSKNRLNMHVKVQIYMPQLKMIAPNAWNTIVACKIYTRKIIDYEYLYKYTRFVWKSWSSLHTAWFNHRGLWKCPA